MEINIGKIESILIFASPISGLQSRFVKTKCPMKIEMMARILAKKWDGMVVV